MIRNHLTPLLLGLAIFLIVVVSAFSFIRCADFNGWDRLWVCADRIFTVRESPRNTP